MFISKLTATEPSSSASRQKTNFILRWKAESKFFGGETPKLYTFILEEQYLILIFDAVRVKDDVAARRLKVFIDVINETVGDAISDMLAVEVVLQSRQWSIQDWEATYTDLPNVLKKLTVKVRF